MFARDRRSGIFWIVVFVSFGAILALHFTFSPTSVMPTAAQGVVINITEQGFDPPLVTVPAGETVTWVNATERALTISDEGFVPLYLPIIPKDADVGSAAAQAAQASGADGAQRSAVPTQLFQQVVQPGESFSFTFESTSDHAIYILELPAFFGRLTVVVPQGGQVRGHIYTSLSQIQDELEHEFDKIYLPDVTVYLVDAANQEVGVVRTDLSGRFSIPHQKAGTYTLCWKADGFQPGCSSTAVTIASQSVHVGDILISPIRDEEQAVVYGKVHLADHSLPRTYEPFADVNAYARIRAHDADDNALGGAYVNNFGVYLLPQVPVDSDVWVQATIDSEVAERRVAAGTMPPFSAHRVDVRMLNHRPLFEPLEATVGGEYARVAEPGQTIQLHAEATDPDGDKVSFRWILASTSGKLSSNRGSDVEWTLPEVPALHRVEVIASDGRGGYAKSAISMEATKEGVLFSGRIVNPGGNGIADARVEINGTAATTNPSGFFRLRTPQSSQYIMNVHKAGYALLSRIYVDGHTNGQWTLTPATVVLVDPTTGIDVRDEKRVCIGAISQRINWEEFPNQGLPRYQDGSGQVVQVGSEAVRFEDLSVGSRFSVGQQFVDADITMELQPFVLSNGQPTTNGFALVDDAGNAGGTGHDLRLNNANVAFQLKRASSLLTIQFGEYGGNVNLTINGKLANVADFGLLDGTTLGDVAIAVTNVSGPVAVLQLSGPVEELAIGGQELWIDDVEVDPLRRLPRQLPCEPGMRVQIPPNALVDAAGNPPPGTVNLSVGTYDILSPDGMPGDYTAADSGGNPSVMESFGAGSVRVSDGATEYNLRAGTVATLTLSVASIHFDYGRPIPATIPNLVYDETTGIWEEIGEWMLVGNEYVTTVEHFSEFNTDLLKEDQACVRIVSDTLPPTYRLEITIPQGTDAAPKVISGVVDNSVPFHVVYNLPTDTDIVLVAIDDDEDIPIGTFVVDTGDPQDPTNPNRPEYNYAACQSEVVLYDPALSDPPSLSQSPSDSFLHGLYNFHATNADEFSPAAAVDFAQATADYYATIDPHDLRDTLNDFISTNNYAAGTEIHAVYANSGDLGFGRDMHCTRTEVSAGVYDVACYVSNYGTGYDALSDGGGYGTPDETDFENAANEDGLIATVAMEYSRVEDPLDVTSFLSNDRIVKFYVYGADGSRIDGTDGSGVVDVNNAFVDLDGFGGRPLPQLCVVCHGGAINYDGAPSATNPPVFDSFADVDMGSVFLPFDLNAFTIVDGLTVNGVLGEFDKANQQEEFRDLNQEIVLVSDPGAPIEELVDYFYPPLGGPDGGDQDEDFVVSGWDTDVAHQTMYREVMTPACRACHIAQINAPGPTLDTAAEAVAFAGGIRQRVCLQGVMPHARATYDRFWTSIGPHQPSQLIAWGTTYASGLDWSDCATAGPDDAPPIPDVVFHDADVQPIWNDNCIACHPPAYATLDLTDGEAYGDLVNHPADQAALDRIEPFNPAQSYLWHKINGTQGSVGGSGVQMPQGGSLTATEIAIIEQWIDDGAVEAE